MHTMRSRIIQSPSFTDAHVLGAILFEDTMDREIDGRESVSYVWDVKHIVPFLKVDKGLVEEQDGVQVMKPIPNLASLLSRGERNGVFGTKMRSFIKLANRTGINAVIDQQFQLAGQIIETGLVPIIEPEIDIHSTEKREAEQILKERVSEHLTRLASGQYVILKLSLPDVEDFYSDFVKHPNVLRVLALSGGYSQADVVARLSGDHGVIASFSRALTEGLSADQSEKDFDATLEHSVSTIFEASVT